MASPIIFRIQDGVDPQIAKNVSAIGDAAQKADGSIQALTQALQAIQNSGLQGLASQLSATSASTTRLSNTTAKMASAALDASVKIDKLVTSYGNLNSVVTASITTLSAFATALRSANTTQATFTQNVRRVGSAGHESVSGVQAASAAIRGLEGNFGTSVRAGERFLVTSLRLGPILQAAFPVFGALALVGVLDIMVQHINKLTEAFKALSIAERESEVAAILAGEKILKIKPEGFFSATNFARQLEGNPNTPKTLEIQNAQAKIKEIQFAKELADAQAITNEKGLQGVALANARIAAIQKEIEFTKQSKAQVDLLTKSFKDQLIAVTVDKNEINNEFGIQTQADLNQPTSKHLLITDPAQVKALEGEMRTAQQASVQLNHEIDLLGEKLKGEIKKEPIAALKDEAKAAVAQMKLFNDQLAILKQSGRITAQDKLALFQQQREKALPQNRTALDIEIGNTTQVIERQAQAYELANEKLKDQVDNIGLYSNALREANEFDKISLNLKKNGVELTTQQTATLKDLIHQSVSQIEFQRELRKVYDEFNAPANELQAGLDAINKLEKDGAITASQAAISQRQLLKAFDDVNDPLFEFNHNLQDQISLLGNYGTEAIVAAEIQRVQNDLRNKGRELTTEQTKSLIQLLSQLEREKQIDQAVNQIYQQNKGAIDKLTASITALNIVRQKGIITQQQYNNQLAQERIRLAELNIEIGKFSKTDVLTATFGNFIKDFKGLSAGIVQTWQQAFDTIANGAANALGRAIAYGEDLGKALQDVARQALSELISGFIKLGLQWIINKVIAETAGNAAVASAVAQGTAVASAWASAAAFVSLATLGANAAAATAAISATLALTHLASALHFNTGGIVPGFGNRDTVPALLTPGEGVLNQAATRFIGTSTIQAWNNGQFTQSAAGQSSSASGRQSLVLNLIHDKNAVDVAQLNENTIRIIAKQEAQSAVATHAPTVIATQISDPNSRVRKSLSTHTDVRGKH